MNPATTIQTLRWFVRTSRGIRLRSIANTLTGVIGVGLDFAFIWATKRCIDTATHQTEGSLTESALLLGAVMASIIALGFARNWLAAILGVQSTNKIQRRMFETVLGRVNEHPTQYKFNQDGGRLRTVSRGVDSLEKAHSILKKLQ